MVRVILGQEALVTPYITTLNKATHFTNERRKKTYVKKLIFTFRSTMIYIKSIENLSDQLTINFALLFYVDLIELIDMYKVLEKIHTFKIRKNTF